MQGSGPEGVMSYRQRGELPSVCGGKYYRTGKFLSVCGGRGSLREDGAWGVAEGLGRVSKGLGRVSKGLGVWGLEGAGGLGPGGGRGLG